MSLHPLPQDHVGAVVTSLAMTQRPLDENQDQPASDAPLRVRTWRGIEPSAYRALFRKVGARWLWYSRLAMRDAELAAAIGEVHVMENVGGEAVGFFELDVSRADVCLIRFLGLVPELAGKGHGPWVFRQLLTRAWRPGVTRVEVNTCSLDHPAALPAYLKAGFRVVGRSLESFPDPRLTGLLPRDCAPQIPLLGTDGSG